MLKADLPSLEARESQTATTTIRNLRVPEKVPDQWSKMNVDYYGAEVSGTDDEDCSYEPSDEESQIDGEHLALSPDLHSHKRKSDFYQPTVCKKPKTQTKIGDDDGMCSPRNDSQVKPTPK